jgi:hypothetical protein
MRVYCNAVDDDTPGVTTSVLLQLLFLTWFRCCSKWTARPGLSPPPRPPASLFFEEGAAFSAARPRAEKRRLRTSKSPRWQREGSARGAVGQRAEESTGVGSLRSPVASPRRENRPRFRAEEFVSRERGVEKRKAPKGSLAILLT